jgi:hypothetical protein
MLAKQFFKLEADVLVRQLYLEIRTRLNNWKFRRLGEVQPGSLENPPRVNKKSARAVKSVAPFFL